jgi:hypothetical protein
MRKKIQPSLTAAGPEQEKRTIPPALAAHSWRPGQSGNPGGRTFEFADCQRLCREASPDAARRLIALMNSEDERVALMAADKVLERAWGRPKEPERSDSLEQRIARMTPEERARDALELAERVRRRLAEHRMTIEHQEEPEPAPESPPGPESQDYHLG